MSVETDLLPDLKDYLNIAYTDKQTDRLLTAALSRGMALLEDYAGNSLDFVTEGAVQQLLFDYCRYVRAQATEMFEINFRHDLIALRRIAETEAVNDEEDTDTD